MPSEPARGSATPICGRRGVFWAALLLVAGAAIFGAPRSVVAQPGEASVFVNQAIIAYEDKAYENALAALGKALQFDPGNVDALYYTGLVYVATGQLDRASEALETALRREPSDLAIQFQLGAVYFAQEKYNEAKPLLERVFAAKPRVDNLGYYVGFLRYRSKDYQGALRAFRAGTSTDPNIQQLTHFYAGLALGVLGLPEQATAELDDVLRLQPGSRLTGPAERLLGAVTAAREGERRFHAEIRIGGFYDTNVPVLPSASGDPIVTALNTQQKTSLGELGSLRLDYSFLRKGPWEATGTFSVFGTYNNDLPRFNIFDVLGGVGGTYRGIVNGTPYQVGLQYTYDYVMLGGDEFLQRNTVVPSVAVSWNSWNLTAAQLRYQSKQFANQEALPSSENRSGPNYMAGFVHLFRFAEDKHLLKVGYQFDYEDTHGSDYQYTGNRFIAGAQYTLPWWTIRLNGDFDVHLRDYLHKHQIFPVTNPGTVKRFDTEYNFVFTATLPLPYSLSLSAVYQGDWNNSNIDVYTYTRNVGTLLMTWKY
jgi:TolA-binding protein